MNAIAMNNTIPIGNPNNTINDFSIKFFINKRLNF